MTQKQRLEEIRQTIRQDRRVVVSDLSFRFDVTEETIRRDLDKLEAEGILARTYGGAVLSQQDPSDSMDYDRRAGSQTAEKAKIAELAAGILPMKGILAADASSTVQKALEYIQGRTEITVLTYSARPVRDLDGADMQIILSGGIVDRSTLSLTGAIVKRTFSSYFTDMALISCKGIGKDSVIYDAHEEENELKKVMIARASKVILMVDHTKFGRVAFAKMADLKEIDILITDRKPSAEWMEIFRENSIEVLY